MVNKLKDLGLLILAVLAVSFGVGWGFTHMKNRALRTRAQRAETQVKTLEFQKQVQQEVNLEKAKLSDRSPQNLDHCADALFP